MLVLTLLGAIAGGAGLIYAVSQPQARFRRFWVLFGSLLIAMGGTGLTMLVAGTEAALRTDWWPWLIMAVFGVGLATVVLLSTGMASWVGIESSPAGAYLRVRLPQIGGKRRLRKEAISLSGDIHSHLATAPPSFDLALMGQREMAGAKDEAERREIWARQTQMMVGESDRQSRELAQLFGGRLRYVTDEFRRRGLLSERDAQLLVWQSGSYHWIKDAASQIEALARKL